MNKKKNVNEELEKEINSWIPAHITVRECANQNIASSTIESIKSWAAMVARHFAEWQEKHMIEALRTEYEKGRHDMHEETMKNAIGAAAMIEEGEIWCNAKDLNPFNLKEGEPITIIIIKSEQQ